MQTVFRAAILIVFLLFVPIVQAETKHAKWDTLVGGGDTFFPAVILATFNMDVQLLMDKITDEFVGDPMGAFGIKIRTEGENTKIRVSITIDGLSETSTIEETLPKANTEYIVLPYVRYKTDALWKIKQPYPTTAVFNVSVNDIPEKEVIKKIKVRPVNDVPYVIRQDGKDIGTQFLFAAFVNETAPVIDKILQDALAHNAVDRFVGYSGNKQEVYRQIFAIWNALQRKGVRYSNIPTPSGFSKTVQSQHVRLPDESYGNSQANCVDGSVLLASALYKIGMCPLLLIQPGHMFLGVHTDKNMCDKETVEDVAFIETTKVGAIMPLNRFQKAWKFKTATGYMDSTSYRSMKQAMESGRRAFNSMVPFLRLQKPGYAVLDIRKLRNMGMTPITSGEHEFVFPKRDDLGKISSQPK